MLSAVLRKEHKNQWERRSALTPSAVKTLLDKGYKVDVEQSDIRVFNDQSFVQEGANLVNTPSEHQLVIGIKEPPVESILPQQVHIAFSHTIKGQPYNMPLLQRFIDQKATLFDYETIVNERGARTIAFGRFAGIAGAIDTFWIAGEKLALINKSSDLQQLRQTKDYASIQAIKAEFEQLDLQKGEPIRALVVGTGNVGRGAEEVCRWLKLPKIDIESILLGHIPEGSWYAVASSRHINARVDGGDFEYDNFVANGASEYVSTFDQLLGKFNVLIQTPYWTEKYPKHLNKPRMVEHQQKLPWVIGDISCDIDGSLECTKKASTIDAPAFTYNVSEDTAKDGISWEGPTVMSIDNLPCELSKDASEHFSAILKNYVPHLMDLDLTMAFDDLELHPELYRSLIVYQGKLTPNYKYLKQYLNAQ
ncbi:MAG: alanine dehydrogenase [Gammaproteobacteria bacterium]|nr:alanine dehydrogenase [Gammaproteobacteria bacterium]NVK88332.1 alanine dehydrogenase [Gammaproteobacteria bacterium]